MDIWSDREEKSSRDTQTLEDHSASDRNTAKILTVLQEGRRETDESRELDRDEHSKKDTHPEQIKKEESCVIEKEIEEKERIRKREGENERKKEREYSCNDWMN